VRLRSNLNKNAQLTPGKVIGVGADATRMPKANKINLNELLSSSKLYLMGPWPGGVGVEANAAKQRTAPAITVPLGDATQTAGTVIVQQEAARQALQAAQAAVLAERQQAARVAFAAQQRQKASTQVQSQAQPSQPVQAQPAKGNQGNAFGQEKVKNVPPGQAKKQ
jgi:hypothetical protein